MTVKEYNEVYLPKHNRALGFINSFDHAVSKSGAYEEVMKQVKIIGWSEETKEVILHALSLYHREIREEMRRDFDNSAVWLRKGEEGNE